MLARADIIHKKALEVVIRFKRCEVDLIEVLGEADTHKIFYSFGFNSLFKYATDALGLSDEVAYIFINVARKTIEVPALKEEIRNGNITVSKARNITSVLKKENQTHWLELAKSSSKRKLEREVALVSPKQAVREKLQYIHQSNEIKDKATILALPETRVQLQVGVSEKLMLELRRVQDVLSQKKQRPVGLEEAIAAMTDLYLTKEDPLEKAKRQKMRGKLQGREHEGSEGREHNGREHESRQLFPGTVTNYSAAKTVQARKPITASVRHRITLQYQGQCSHIDVNGNRCQQKRFLHIHHVHSVRDGGSNELSNLELLCSGHHKVRHHYPGHRT